MQHNYFTAWPRIMKIGQIDVLFAVTRLKMKRRVICEEVLRIYRGYLFFSVKDRNLFHRVNTIGNIFTNGEATGENITDGVHEMK